MFGFDYTFIVWVVISIILNIAVYYAVKDVVLHMTESWSRREVPLKMLGLFKRVNILLWVIIIVVIVLFFSPKYREVPIDMGGVTIQNEVKEILPSTKEEIEAWNKESLQRKDIERKEEIEREDKKSSEAYDKIIGEFFRKK